MAVNFKILFWRNFQSEKRMLAHTCGEILVIILLGVLIIADSSTNIKKFLPTKYQRSNVRIYAENKLEDLNILRKQLEDEEFPYSLAFEPNVNYAKIITKEIAEKLQLAATTNYIPNYFLAKLSFGNYNGEGMPKNLTLSIRLPGTFRTFKSNRMQSNLWVSRCTGSLANRMDDRIHDYQTDLYIREGFLQLQHLAFMEWLQRRNVEGSSEYEIGVRSFKYKTRKRLCHPNYTSNISSLIYHFMFLLPFLNLIWKYGRETEENMMAHHWRYGCDGFLYWSSHFVCSFLHFIVLDIVVFILTIISWETRDQPEFTDELSSLYLLGILLLTACELIICAMVIAILIPCAINAIYLGILLWVFIYAVFSIILEYSVDLKSFWMIFCLIIMFNSDFAYGMRYLTNIDESTATNIGYLFAIIAGSTFLKLIYLIFAQYAKPGRYVQQRPFHFFGLRNLHKSCKSKKNCASIRTKPTLQEQISSWENSQFGPLHGQKNVIVWQVSKTAKSFRQPAKNVLRKVNMLIFQGEITAILGHFCSGKTTFVSLLAGWQKPNNGVIEILEKNIHCDKTAMKLVDISMPNNALFDHLTAYETLMYFVTVKGNFERREQSNDEIQKWLRSMKTLFRMGEEHKMLVKDMNFDQKRLLALCCVLSCGTKIIVLDEPTLHMRVKEQRLYWSILQREKADRSIIVTTTSFREAETIGDRIAVLNDGLLKAYGTSMFLKSMFGTGFDLIILKERDAPSGRITNFLKEYIPDIVLDNENHHQLIYKIPMDRRSVFQIMLIQLEKRYSEFGITDTRLLTTDLSEVYLSLGKSKEKPRVPDVPQALSVDFLPKKKRIRQQWAALCFKKFKHQPSTIIPLFMCLSSILLITLLTQLFVVFRDGGQVANRIVLGFDENHDRRLLRFMDNCKVIGIRKVQMGNSLPRDKSLSFTFVPGSFFCSKNSFLNYVKKPHHEMGHMYGAIEINNGSKFTVYVNQHIFHSAPLALNLLHNYLLEKNFQLQYDVVARIINDPIPIPAPHATGLLNSEIEHLILPLAIGFIIPITICTFIFAVVEERKTSILSLMSIAGLRIDIYWFVNFIWDWLTFFVYSIFFQIIIIILFYDELRINDSLLIFLIINIYSIPLLASIYFLSMLNQSSRFRAYAIACLFHVISGLFSFVVFWDVLLAQTWYLYVFLFLPTFAMLDGVSNVFVMSRYLKKCTQLCKTIENCDLQDICGSIFECCEYSFFEWGNSGILRSIIFLLLVTIIIILLMFWVEIHQRESKFLVTPRIKQMYTRTFPYDDENITIMRERIATADLRTIGKKRLVVDQVERRIPENSVALSTVSFDVEKQFCLAIYGTHRVGKSRLCRQIVGREGFHFGDIYIRGIPVKYNINDAWMYLGYTPQRLTVMTGFTVNEILHFFCLLRGVPKGAIPTVASDISSLFNLDRVKNRKIARLSKGTQRKVNIAVALVATNKVIILDEPTRGLPQFTAREIWKILRYLCSCGKSIVIATSSMYECDAIADTVLVIDEENMLAYGSSQYLRAKHIGFYLEIRLRRDGSTAEEVEENLRVDVDNLHRFMIFMHSDSILVNRIDNCLKFYLPVEKINFNILYGSLERNRVRLNISDYTVSQGNFEEVLKSIAAKRDPARFK